MGGNKNKIKSILIHGGITLSLFFASCSVAEAVSLYLIPNSGTYNVGDSFSISARVNSNEIAINAVEGVIAFNPNELQVISISKVGSIMNLWTREPEYSNSLGTISFAGIAFNPGYTGTDGEVLSVSFRAKAFTDANVSFSSGAVLANDGAGTNVLSNLEGGLYIFEATSTMPRIAELSPTMPRVAEPSPEAPVSLLPIIESSTHPDSNKWYSKDKLEVRWDLPDDVDFVSFLVHPREVVNPGTISDGLVSSAEFEDLRDGVSYFHLRFHNSAGWGPIARYQFKTDQTAPSSFMMERATKEDLTDPTPELIIEPSEDATSDVSHYEIKIGDKDWVRMDLGETEESYEVSVQPPGEYLVLARAYDEAGNYTVIEFPMIIESIETATVDNVITKTEVKDKIIVNGTAPPSSKVIIYVVDKMLLGGQLHQPDVDIVKTIETISDENGDYTVEIFDLRIKDYTVYAYTVDNREAISYRSNEVAIYGFSLIEWMKEIVDFSVWLRVISILVLLYLIKLLGRKTLSLLSRGKKIFKRSKTKREEKNTKELAKLRKDMEEEIELLRKLSKRRGLNPEEKYLKDKMTQYLKALKIFSSD